MSWRDSDSDPAAVFRDCGKAFAVRDSNPLREATGGSDEIADWRHYPAGEAYDPHSQIQYFFHRHGPAAVEATRQPTEAGHFHVFLRGDGIPAGIAPLLLPDAAVANAPRPPQSAPLKRGARDEVCHIVAVAIDRRGAPIRLFTTNRWVTGETWYRGEDVVRLLGRVRFGHARPPALLDRWIEALVRLFQPEIVALLRRRDKAIVDWRWRWPRSNVFEDQRLEIVSSCEIDVAARLAALETQAIPPATAVRGGARLPSMAEGWGA